MEFSSLQKKLLSHNLIMPKKIKKSEKEKIPVGRPPFYKSAEELQLKIAEYFKKGVNKKKVWQGEKLIEIPIPTITGLVLYCGFCDRHSFYAYEAKPEFSYTIKKARSFIENEYEELLHGGSCTGAIFALKNFGWIDKTEVARPEAENQTQEVIGEQLSRIAAILSKRKVS